MELLLLQGKFIQSVSFAVRGSQAPPCSADGSVSAAGCNDTAQRLRRYIVFTGNGSENFHIKLLAGSLECLISEYGGNTLLRNVSSYLSKPKKRGGRELLESLPETVPALQNIPSKIPTVILQI